MLMFSENKINKSISVLRKWIPDLEISKKKLSTNVHISIDYNALGIKKFHFLIIYEKKKKNNKDLVKVYFVLPNYEELSALLSKAPLDSLDFIRQDYFGNPYLHIKSIKKNPYDGINIISSIVAVLQLLEKLNQQ